MSDTDTQVPLPDLNAADAATVGDIAYREDENAARVAADLEAVFDVPVQVSAVLGRSKMEVGELLKLGPGTVLELDRRVGEAIDIYVNNRLVARGEVVLVEDKLGVTMTEIIKTQKIMEHPLITTRVAAVDEELGIVLLRMNFGQTSSYGEGNALIVRRGPMPASRRIPHLEFRTKAEDALLQSGDAQETIVRFAESLPSRRANPRMTLRPVYG